MTDGNGVRTMELQHGELPPAREAIIDQAHRLHQEVAHQRDMLLQEVAQLKSDMAAYKVMVEALQGQLAQADSRVASMTTVRDDAVRREAEVKAALASMLAIGRAFEIRSEPLITGSSDHEDISTMSGHDRAIALELRRRQSGG